MKIKLNVNQNNMMEVFGQSFRSRESVIVELLQNARRAGATDVLGQLLQEPAWSRGKRSRAAVSDAASLGGRSGSGLGAKKQRLTRSG